MLVNTKRMAEILGESPRIVTRRAANNTIPTAAWSEYNTRLFDADAVTKMWGSIKMGRKLKVNKQKREWLLSDKGISAVDQIHDALNCTLREAEDLAWDEHEGGSPWQK